MASAPPGHPRAPRPARPRPRPRGRRQGRGGAAVRQGLEGDEGPGTAAFEAARADRLAWIAYPKARQLGTDLDRDTLRAAVEPEGIRPVRPVALDGTWSALRFRPA